MLDIGSGPGFFLKTAASRGWSVRGVEPSRQAAAHATSLGVDVVEGFFNAETAARLGQFDVVHLNNVLEHVPNALEIVCLARDLLTPGGLICLNVPNDFTPFQQSARSTLTLTEWWVAPPHHLNYFDFDSLSRLVTRLGFEVRERSTIVSDGAVPADGPRLHEGQRSRTRLPQSAQTLRPEPRDTRASRRRAARSIARWRPPGLGREAAIIAVKK